MHKEQKTILQKNNNIISNKKTYSTFNKSENNLQNIKTNKTNITHLYNKPTTKKEQVKINTTYANNKTNTINTYNKINKTIKIRTFYNSGKYTHRQIVTLNDQITKQINSQQKESNKKSDSSIKEKNSKENESSSINIIEKKTEKPIPENEIKNKDQYLENIKNPKLKEILKEQLEIYKTKDFENNGIKTQHEIFTEGPPTHAKARQLPPEKLEAAKSIFKDLLDNKTISQSNSEWSSPLMMKKKSNGEWRCCGDYRKLNNITKSDAYPVPLIKDLTTRLNKATIFSKIDLIKAYYQIPMHKDHIKKTAIITPFGLYEFNKMPFGLKNAAATFQRIMDNIFMHETYAVVYLDDILIGSTSESEHLEHIEKVVKKLTTNGLKINFEKCEF